MDCVASERCRWLAFGLGIHELGLPDGGVGAASNFMDMMLQMVQSTLLNVEPATRFGNLAFSRLLRSLTLVLANGASPNARLLVQERYVDPTRWDFLVWHSIMTSPGVPIQALWLLFLLHGADVNFHLTFRKPTLEICEDSEDVQDVGNKEDGEAGSCAHWAPNASERPHMLMSGQFGRERVEPFSPVAVAEDHGGIVELARSQNWTVSLLDIVSFWFPEDAKTFRKLIELNESHGDERDDMRKLRRDYGFDLDNWQAGEWEIPRPLLQPCSGSSRLKVKAGSSKGS